MTGRQRFSARVTLGDTDARPPVVGDGLLVLRERDSLAGYSSLLNPRPTGLEEVTFDGVIRLGKSALLTGALGRALRQRGPATVNLLGDTFPYGKFRQVKSTRTFGDGGYSFRVRPRLNTRYRSTSGSGKSQGGTVYVYPSFSERVRRGRGRRINRIRATVTARTPARVRLGRKRFHLYLVRVKRRKVQRLDSGRLRQAGRGRARGVVRFTAIRGLRRGDFFFYCVRRLSRQGMGARDVIDRRCGARRLPY